MGRQVLEALVFLKERGFPTVIHLHSGNVLVQNGVARLAGLENTLLGFTSRIHPLIASRISQTISIDMICFGKIGLTYLLNRHSQSCFSFSFFQVICCLRCAPVTNCQRSNRIPCICRTLRYIHKYIYHFLFPFVHSCFCFLSVSVSISHLPHFFPSKILAFR